jgi:Carboxypeptidase regulatory-like domain
MIKKFTILFSVFALLLCLGTVAFGQETTGDIEITVKDPNGAVVPNVSVTVASSETSASATTGFKRTVTTDSDGFVRVIRVQPGVYTITAAPTAGFAERVIPNIQVVLGKVTPVTVDLGVANVDPTTVTVNSTDVSPIDVTDNKIQTNITAETAELLPKGISFASILKVSPATRVEPLSGQFQIDGASGSENVFIIDGQEVTNVRTGVLDATSDLPFQLVQEVQVKSSGFEAEYGGATGGVINVVTKGGSNNWRGETGSQFRPGNLQTSGRNALILNNQNQAEYFPPQKADRSLGFFPSISLGGPILKDKIWFFASYTPQIFTAARTIRYVNPTTRVPTGVVETYTAKTQFDYYFARVDAQPFSRLRLTSAWTYNPLKIRGAVPGGTESLNTVLPNNGLPPTNPNFLDGADYLNQTGGRNNSQSITGQAVWTPLNNLVLSFRGGHYFLNEKSGSYGIGNVAGNPRITCSTSSPQQFPAGFGCIRGFNNGLPVNSNVQFDVTTRNTFDTDATYIFNGAGRNELKGGYQYNGISNNLISDTRDQIVLRYGQTIASYSGRAIPSSPNAVGAGLLRQFREQGDVSSKNEGLYIQDKWQPFNRLTLNLGVRIEKEDVPSFADGLEGIQFDWMDKIAPRIGGAFDLTGDGKTKVAAFYGWFYDRFKYELPRGSFGGQFFHDFYYEIFPGDTLATFTPANILGSYVATIGGACPNSTTPVGGRVRCDIDFRVPSNSGLGIEFGAIDPNIKAFRQSELTFTVERILTNNLLFSARYTRKNVDRTIEDAGFLTSTGSEAYVIGNPGQGLYAEVAEANGLLALKPQRLYQALEFRLDRRFSNDWFFNLNYTYSRLYGNYSGLASSDEDGRLSPNVNRFFDLPHAGFTVAGGEDNGLLPTDRPHVLKFYGAFNLDWNKRFGFGENNETLFSIFTTAQSGTPLTTTVDILSIDTIVLNERGDLGRTETFTQTDFALRHRFKFGRDNRFTIIGEVDILNLFNEANELSRQNLITITNYDPTDPFYGILTPAEAAQDNAYALALGRFQRNGAAGIATDANALANRYPLFNLTNAFQGGREIRFGFRFLF